MAVGYYTAKKITGTFGATGQSDSIDLAGQFNLSLSGWGSATVRLERSFDGGSSWVVVKSYTVDAEEVGDAPEPGVLYRLNCTSYTSGTIAYRLSQ